MTKDVPFYPNTKDNNQCMVSVYRSILEYFLKKPFTQKEVRDFVGYKNGLAAWSLAPLTKMVPMGFDIRMIEPFDYRAYATQGTNYLSDFFSEDELKWLLRYSNILDIRSMIPEFLRTVHWEKRRGNLTDIDSMLLEGRLVTVTLNLAALNDEEGTAIHAVLITDRDKDGYVLHDPGAPPKPYRRVPRPKLWEAMGGDTHNAEVTGFKLKSATGQRLDQYVVTQRPQLGRAFATKLIGDHRVLVNELPSKPGYKLKEDDQVSINYDTQELDIPDIELPILYEDGDCLVINKPIGILTHSKGPFNSEATVASFIRKHLSGLSGERAGIVHRLDRATSGIIICAKNQPALVFLQKQFSQRKAQKTYYAIVNGHMPHAHALIDMPIERNPKKPQTFRTGPQGRPAITEYQVLKENKDCTLLKLMPKTGRTHQLRIHLSELGHPILGDTLYGGQVAERLFLHAAELEITLPSHERKRFSAPTPHQFHDIMKKL